MEIYHEKELLKLSRNDLYSIARDRQIPRRSALTKQELLEAILNSQIPEKFAVTPEKTVGSKGSDSDTSNQSAPQKSLQRKAKRPAPMEEVFSLPEEAIQAERAMEQPAHPKTILRPGPVAGKHPIVAAQSVDGRVSGHEATGELPPGYGDNRIVLQARDPFWAHTYWEMSFQVRDRLREALGDERYDNSRFVLRVYDVTSLTFTGDNAHSFYDVSVSEGAGNWYLHLNKPDRSFVVDLGLISPEGRFYLIARSNTIHAPRCQASSSVDSDWEISDKDYQKLYKLSGGGQIGVSSGELIESISRGQELNLSSGSVSSLSSPGKLSESTPGKNFRLEVRTELIVFGATEPDAQLTVQGQPVPLRSDGTFSLRFALPDGEQIIPVRAVNVDGDLEQTITPQVAKTTC